MKKDIYDYICIAMYILGSIALYEAMFKGALR